MRNSKEYITVDIEVLQRTDKAVLALLKSRSEPMWIAKQNILKARRTTANRYTITAQRWVLT